MSNPEIPDFLNRRRTPPPMPDEQRRAVLRLSPIQALRVWRLCKDRDPKFPDPPMTVADSTITATAEATKALLLAALERGNGTAELVCNCLRDPRADDAVEVLTGKPIKHLAPLGRARPPKPAPNPYSDAPTEPPAAATPRKPVGLRRPQRPGKQYDFADDDVISAIVPNPKRPGLDPYMRFAQYREGMTVAEAIAKGVTPADVVWDRDHSYIVLTKKEKA